MDFICLGISEMNFQPSEGNFKLTLPAPRISESCIKIKINLNFYFHTSLWCLKRFYEGIYGLHKTLVAPQKKCENKNLS